MRLAPRARILSNIAGRLDNYKLYSIHIKNTRPLSYGRVWRGPRYWTMRKAERLAAISSKMVLSDAVSGAK